MRNSKFAGLRNRFRLAAVLSVLALSVPTAVSAQTETVDRDFLNSFYTFLQGQDDFSYQLATGWMGDETNVWLAKGVCLDFDRGLSPAEGYDLFVSAARTQMQGLTQQEYDRAAYAVDLYGGALMNLGSAYYCPQYQPQVEAALRSR
ncbi:MAG: hypothetical protein AAFN12_06785 [Cyanobacteria bacterium J06560_2]